MGTGFRWGKLIIFDRRWIDTSIHPLGAKDAALELELAD